MSAEFLGQFALANGIECNPLAESRDDIVAKLEEAGIEVPED